MKDDKFRDYWEGGWGRGEGLEAERGGTVVVCYYALTKYLLIPVSDAMTWQNLTCNKVGNLHECLVPMRALKFVLSN
jgi:hypothetical protein